MNAVNLQLIDLPVWENGVMYKDDILDCQGLLRKATTKSKKSITMHILWIKVHDNYVYPTSTRAFYKLAILRGLECT